MANPQCENGFTRLANELLEALAHIRIPGKARQVLDVILRKTYGFNKKEDAISLSQFCLATGLSKPHVCHSLTKLKTMNLIVKKGNGHITTYSINKDFDQWKALPKKITLPKKEMGVAEKGKNHCRKRVPQKKKETITKETHPQVFDLVDLLGQRILKNNPKHTQLSNGKYQATVQRWAADIDKLHRVDGQSFGDIQMVIDWCQADAFWKKNILSGAALRSKWDRLILIARDKQSASIVPEWKK